MMSGITAQTSNWNRRNRKKESCDLFANKIAIALAVSRKLFASVTHTQLSLHLIAHNPKSAYIYEERFVVVARVCFMSFIKIISARMQSCFLFAKQFQFLFCETKKKRDYVHFRRISVFLCSSFHFMFSINIGAALCPISIFVVEFILNNHVLAIHFVALKAKRAKATE